MTPPIRVLHNTRPQKRPAPPALLVTNSRKPRIAHLRIAIQRGTRVQRRRLGTRVGALSPGLRLNRRRRGGGGALGVVRGVEVGARRGRLLGLGLRHAGQRVQGRQGVLGAVDGGERRGAGTAAHGAEEGVRVTAGVRGAVRAGQRVDAVGRVRDGQVGRPVLAWRGRAGGARVASHAVFRRGVWVGRGWCAFPVTALAAERLVCGCWRYARAAFGLVQAVFLVFLQLV